MSDHIPYADTDSEHVLYRKRVSKSYEAVHFEDDGESMPAHSRTKDLGLHLDPVIERSKTIYCTCGEAFRKDETARDHVEAEGTLDEHESESTLDI